MQQDRVEVAGLVSAGVMMKNDYVPNVHIGGRHEKDSGDDEYDGDEQKDSNGNWIYDPNFRKRPGSDTEDGDYGGSKVPTQFNSLCFWSY